MLGARTIITKRPHFTEITYISEEESINKYVKDAVYRGDFNALKNVADVLKRRGDINCSGGKYSAIEIVMINSILYATKRLHDSDLIDFISGVSDALNITFVKHDKDDGTNYVELITILRMVTLRLEIIPRIIYEIFLQKVIDDMEYYKWKDVSIDHLNPLRSMALELFTTCTYAIHYDRWHLFTQFQSAFEDYLSPKDYKYITEFIDMAIISLKSDRQRVYSFMYGCLVNIKEITKP